MRARLFPWLQSDLTRLFVVVMSLSLALLGAFTYRATDQWRQSATLLATRRAQQGADLLALALIRDMRSAQVSVLSSHDWRASTALQLADTSHLLASAFARLSYPEVFFLWREDEPTSAVRFFTRLERPPKWLTLTEDDDLFPVAIGSAPAVSTSLIERASRDAIHQRRFSLFDLRVGSHTYQVVSRLSYIETERGHLRSIAGFMVNLNWVREHYFGEIAQQVSRITRADSALTFSLTQAAYLEGPHRSDSIAGTRTLVMAFFDPLVVAIDKPPDLTLEQWTITAHAASDEMLDSARVGTRQTLFITAMATLVFAAGLGLTFRATRTEAALTQLRADFVSTVTHELKTPVAAIRAAADTLVSHRVSQDAPPRKYAHMIVEQSQQLTRLLDNMLAYSRITDLTKAYSFTAVSIGELIDEVIQHAQLRLERGQFELSIAMPADLPAVRADRTALYLAFENLIDNAIRYSRERRWIKVSASADQTVVHIDVVDHGIGIPAAELSQVTQRFFRGSGSGPGGTGLGLAIAQRIVLDHGGSLSLDSQEGAGTTVRMTLPIATTT